MKRIRTVLVYRSFHEMHAKGEDPDPGLWTALLRWNSVADRPRADRRPMARTLRNSSRNNAEVPAGTQRYTIQRPQASDLQVHFALTKAKVGGSSPSAPTDSCFW